MADDLTDAQSMAQAMQGIENHPFGFIILRLVRLIFAAKQRMDSLDARIKALGG